MPFTLPDLPYDRQALAPHMSAETLEFHHGKHHKAYVDKTNALVADKGQSGASLAEVIRAARDGGDKALFNNAGQLWNHNFFWQCLAPAAEGRAPDGRLARLIEEGFGTREAMLARLKEEAVGHFASGWAWLVLDRGSLRITSLHDGDTPVAHEGMQPLFTLDVWEHAYYIDYRNARPAFADAVLGNLVNWDFVARNLDGRGLERADEAGEATPAEVAEALG
ncbi:MAG: superoxide dismutase [Alphaproteobacteria bacterium]|nr:superoxide dismutase [Alphaproteobacteria bacterium]MBV9370253.1 superoxide dismutase [Alphaproteobacteria bacterium]MBV9899738.1 superoxide dismutase [Alphaproteobacteria bacterium]